MIEFKQEIVGATEVFKLSVEEDGEELGFYYLVQQAIDIYEVHTHFYIKAYGSTKSITKLAVVEMFKGLPEMQTLVTKVPINNKLAKNLAKAVGMKVCGSIPDSFKTDDGYIPQELLYLNRKDLVCL